MTDENDGYVIEALERSVIEDIAKFFRTDVEIDRTSHGFKVRCYACGEEFVGESNGLGDALWSMLEYMEDHFKFKPIALKVAYMKARME